MTDARNRRTKRQDSDLIPWFLPGGVADNPLPRLRRHLRGRRGESTGRLPDVLNQGCRRAICSSLDGRGPCLQALVFITRHAFPWEFFPETARTSDTYPSVEQACQAFATAGFRRDALEQVPETLASLAEFLAQADIFRRADTNMRNLSEEEFLRGKERLRRAAQDAEETPRPEPRTNRLDLLVLR